MISAHLSRLVLALEAMAKGQNVPKRLDVQLTLENISTTSDPRVQAIVDQARMTLPIAKGDTMPKDIAKRCETVLQMVDPLLDEALAQIKR
jgi:hypothetical protein